MVLKQDLCALPIALYHPDKYELWHDAQAAGSQPAAQCAPGTGRGRSHTLHSFLQSTGGARRARLRTAWEVTWLSDASADSLGMRLLQVAC